MGFPSQEYCRGLPFPSPGIFQVQGSNPSLLHWQADSLPLSHQGSPHSDAYLEEKWKRDRVDDGHLEGQFIFSAPLPSHVEPGISPKSHILNL